MNKQLTIVDPILVKEYDEKLLNEQEHQLLLVKEALTIQVSVIQQQRDTVAGCVEHFEREMKILYANRVDILETLQQEVFKLLKEQKQDPNSYNSKVEEEYLKEAIDRNRVHNEALSHTPKKSEGIKRLFKKLASKCHPDKTNLPHLHLLFKIAQKAYESNDYEKLESVYKCVVRKTTWAFLSIEQEVSELKTREALIIEQLNNIVNSDLFYMSRDYVAKIPQLKQKASNGYLCILEQGIKKHLSALHQLDPSRYPIPPEVVLNSPTFTFIFSTST